ncbi:MAG: zinc-ribbon domain-containing protein, partial [Gemmataceae bacterium]
MAMIFCPECAAKISDKAVACPKCAYPLKSATIIEQT